MQDVLYESDVVALGKILFTHDHAIDPGGAQFCNAQRQGFCAQPAIGDGNDRKRHGSFGLPYT